MNNEQEIHLQVDLFNKKYLRNKYFNFNYNMEVVNEEKKKKKL